MNPNQPQDEPVLFGAGGNWRVTDEVVDPKVVKQQDDLSCGPACAEMLLKDRGINITNFFHSNTMNIQLVAIKSTQEKETFNVVVLIGEEQHKFTMKVKSFTVANQEIQVTNGDDNFSKIFRFNQIVASDICKLVSKVYNNQAVKLPADMGLYSGEIKPVLL